MSWHPALIDGPFQIPVYGPPETAPGMGEGETYEARPIVGHVDGYHLNVAPELVVEEYRVDPDPATPFREFAGGSTGFLRFPDEATARAVLGAYWIDDTEE
jgi:hypothetical protein